MIISASRRTDLPNYYSDWVFNRLRSGYVLVRNPMNAHQVSRVTLSPEVVDCIVFWTKNPKPMLPRLPELTDYPYYFQFTLNAYGQDLEPGIPSKSGEVIESFQRLSDMLGPKRVIWRYDPIVLTDVYSLDYHKKYYEKLVRKLQGHTEKCVISFMDPYVKKTKQFTKHGLRAPNEAEQLHLAKYIAVAANAYGIKVETCAEQIDLSDFGIGHGSCIDGALISQIVGGNLKIPADRNQRQGCGCVESIDIGAYDTCLSNCQYCYALRSTKTAQLRQAAYDAASELLCSQLSSEDVVKARAMKPYRSAQINPWV